MSQTNERRRWPRIATRFQALHSDGRQECVGVVANLSEWGAQLVATSSKPALGTRVRAQVDVPGRTTPLELDGRVVRHTRDGFAIEYDKLNLEVRRLLEDEACIGVVATDGEEEAPAGGRQKGREIHIRCWVDRLRVSGEIFLPGRRSLVDHVNQQPFLKLRNAEIPGAEPLAFLALRRDSISILVPSEAADGVERDHSLGRFTTRRITALLGGSTLSGRLELLEAVRVSDHLMRPTHFIALRDCELGLRGEAGGLPPRAPVVLVNTRHVVGITEEA